ncbi:MAG: NUDIX hydrolase [Eubacterium sp.]|nr:NUDIX hydrolase [Eubacterium sp.]
MNNKYFTVCGIVEIDGKILLVRHTYGNAEGRILLPGGYVSEGELPTKAAEREIYEETQVKAKVRSVFSIQFTPEQWCVIFLMDYISGTPISDGWENSEILLLTAEEAVQHNDITNLSRAVLQAYINNQNGCLEKSDYIRRSSTENDYAIFGI